MGGTCSNIILFFRGRCCPPRIDNQSSAVTFTYEQAVETESERRPKVGRTRTSTGGDAASDVSECTISIKKASTVQVLHGEHVHHYYQGSAETTEEVNRLRNSIQQLTERLNETEAEIERKKEQTVKQVLKFPTQAEGGPSGKGHLYDEILAELSRSQEHIRGLQTESQKLQAQRKREEKKLHDITRIKQSFGEETQVKTIPTSFNTGSCESDTPPGERPTDTVTRHRGRPPTSLHVPGRHRTMRHCVFRKRLRSIDPASAYLTYPGVMRGYIKRHRSVSRRESSRSRRMVFVPEQGYGLGGAISWDIIPQNWYRTGVIASGGSAAAPLGDLVLRRERGLSAHATLTSAQVRTHDPIRPKGDSTLKKADAHSQIHQTIQSSCVAVYEKKKKVEKPIESPVGFTQKTSDEPIKSSTVASTQLQVVKSVESTADSTEKSEKAVKCTAASTLTKLNKSVQSTANSTEMTFDKPEESTADSTQKKLVKPDESSDTSNQKKLDKSVESIAAFTESVEPTVASTQKTSDKLSAQEKVDKPSEPSANTAEEEEHGVCSALSSCDLLGSASEASTIPKRPGDIPPRSADVLLKHGKAIPVQTVGNKKLPWITFVLVDKKSSVVFLADCWNEKLRVVDLLSLETTGEVELGSRPWGLALAHDGSLIVVTSQTDNTIRFVDPSSMSIVKTITTARCYWGVSWLQDGNLAVSCRKDSEGGASVDVITTEGKLVRSVVQAPLSDPRYLHLHCDQLFVSDFGNGCVYRVDLTAELPGKAEKIAEIRLPCQMTSDPDGTLFVASWVDRHVWVRADSGTWKYRPEGEEEYVNPRCVAVTSDGLLISLDKASGNPTSSCLKLYNTDHTAR